MAAKGTMNAGKGKAGMPPSLKNTSKMPGEGKFPFAAIKGVKNPKMRDKADDAADKKMGIKEGSKKDDAYDKKVGVPMDKKRGK